jgi:hypothetical protein
MTQLAERIHGGILIALAAIFGASTWWMTDRPVAAPVTSVVVVEGPEPAPVVRSACPDVVRTRFDAGYELTCVPGRFPEPGYFVRAKYHTTEAWERLGVVSEDGSKDLAPFNDRPCRHGDAVVSYDARDLDGDGVMELISATTGARDIAFEVLAVRSDGVATVPGPAIRMTPCGSSELSIGDGPGTFTVSSCGDSDTNELPTYTVRDGVLVTL